jgi:non-heme chloroperoxidase
VKTEDARGGTFIETSDRVRLFYQDWGAGGPIVFLHGAGMTSDQWQYNVADFNASGYRCISFDRRGHGRSDRPRHGYVFERLVDDVADVIEALDLRDVTLVGYSLGAIEAVGYMARHRTARVARLVLLAPCTPFVSKTADNPDGVDPAALEALLALWRKDYPAWLQAGIGPFYRPDVFGISKGVADWTIDMMLATPIQVTLPCGLVVAKTDLRAELAEISVPTLVIHGDADASFPPAFGRATAKLVPGARYIEYEGAPHGLFLTHRDAFHADVCAWARGESSSATRSSRAPGEPARTANAL